MKISLKLLVPLLLCLCSGPATALDSAKEYEIKAVYLFNLGNFTGWPITAFNAPDTPFQLCLLGEDPFQGKLDFIAGKKHIHKRKVELHYLENISQAADCHVLYISASEQLRLPKILEWLQDKAILTVSDMERFARRGGMIELFAQDNKVRIALVPQTIEEVGLKPGTNLMQMAQIIDE